MVQQVATWETTEATASDDYYDRLLMTVMMEAAAAAAAVSSPASDSNCSGTTDNVGSNYISSSSSSSNSNSTCSTTFKSETGDDSGDVNGDGDGSNNMCFKIEVDDDEYCGDAATTTVADYDDDDDEIESDVSETKFQPGQLLVKTAATCCSTTAAVVEPENKTLSAATTAVATSGSPSSSQHIHLWQFLKELLTASSAAAELQTTTADVEAINCGASPSSPSASSTTLSNAVGNKPQQPQQMIRWLDRKQGVFKIEDSQAVARLWGRRKNRPAMNYDKLSRSLRQYYKKGIMRKTERSQRLVYQFCHPYNA